MLKYDFEVLKVNPLKGHKIAGTRDYETRVVIHKDDQVLYEGTVTVRKNKEGVFPDVEGVKDKALSQAVRKELSKNLKDYIKKAR